VSRALAAEEADDGAVASKRVRASQPAIRAALQAIKDVGLTVGKVCVAGGKVEIHCGSVEPGDNDERNSGLKPW
jgi:hypothetical protein